MKINEWTLGLAALGLAGLSSVAQADDAATPKAVPLMTAVSATIISGYVDTSAVWNPGTGNANPAPFAFNAGKQDGLNVNLIDIKIRKPLEEGQWSAGYVAELNYGPDSFGIDGAAAPIRQACVELRVPAGNGLDVQFGRFDNLLGYEGSDACKNPNYTRSYGYTIEPTEHTGLLFSYAPVSMLNVQAGIANSVTTAGLNARNTSGSFGAYGFNGAYTVESKKGFISLITLTAPDNWGAFKGSAFYVGCDYGPGYGYDLGGGHPVDKTHLYVGSTLNSPITGLSFGAAWDWVNNMETTTFAGLGPTLEGSAMAIAGYSTYKFTRKASFNARAEYAHGTAFANTYGGSGGGILATRAVGAQASDGKVLALTGTFEYDLWANVISRVEVRWDHSADGSDHFGGNVAGIATKKNDVTVAMNLIYIF